MAVDTTTDNLVLTLQGKGNNNNSWGTINNNNLSYLEDAITETKAISTTGGDTTLTTAEGRYLYLAVSGTLASNANVIAPDKKHMFVVRNTTTGSYTVTVKPSGGSGETVPQNAAALVYCDGAGAASVVGLFYDADSIAFTGGSIDGITLGTTTAVTEAQIDNLNLNGNTIISTDTNGDINLTPNGTGSVVISKADINSGAIDGITLGTNSAVTEAQVDNLNFNGNTISSTDANGSINLTPNGAGSVVISKGDINSGAIDNTTIGSGTPSTGAFTTISGTTISASTAFRAANGSEAVPSIGFSNQTSTGWWLNASGDMRASIAGTTEFILTAGECYIPNVYSDTTAETIYPSVASDGRLRRSTSARKYKSNIKPIPDEFLDKFLGLNGITFTSKCKGDCKKTRRIGIVADQAHESGLKELVAYSKDGEVEGFAYDRSVAILLEIVKRQDGRIQAIEAAL